MLPSYRYLSWPERRRHNRMHSTRNALASRTVPTLIFLSFEVRIRIRGCTSPICHGQWYRRSIAMTPYATARLDTSVSNVKAYKRGSRSAGRLAPEAASVTRSTIGQAAKFLCSRAWWEGGWHRSRNSRQAALSMMLPPSRAAVSRLGAAGDTETLALR